VGRLGTWLVTLPTQRESVNHRWTSSVSMTSSGLLGELAVVPPAPTGKMTKSDVPMKNKMTFALYLLFMGVGIAGLFFFSNRGDYLTAMIFTPAISSA
jgi:hypothetical protein